MKTFYIVIFILSCIGCDEDDSSKTTDASRADLSTDDVSTTDTSSKTDVGLATDSGQALTRCQQIETSAKVAGFSVTVTCDDDYAYIGSTAFPAHEVMTGIIGTNEQTAVPAFDYQSPIVLAPKIAATVTTIDAAVGVAINGVPIYDYTAQGDLDPAVYDERADTVVTGQLDICNGHAGRGDDYHYHASPTCMIASMPNKDDNPIIGWAFDGFPLYGNNAPDGTVIEEGTLGLCNNIEDATYGWRYHTSNYPPYIIQCLIGEVDNQKLPRVPPLRGLTSGDRPSGTPPQGGVENLKMTVTGEARSMTYTYNGSDYFINYEPAEQANCYDFEWDTVSTGTDSGTYCR